MFLFEILHILAFNFKFRNLRCEIMRHLTIKTLDYFIFKLSWNKMLVLLVARNVCVLLVSSVKYVKQYQPIVQLRDLLLFLVVWCAVFAWETVRLVENWKVTSWSYHFSLHHLLAAAILCVLHDTNLNTMNADVLPRLSPTGGNNQWFSWFRCSFWWNMVMPFGQIRAEGTLLEYFEVCLYSISQQYIGVLWTNPRKPIKLKT